ncbi:MAG TPA: helix-turn-helix transcriptional regulator [Trebonia sp.]|jgi:transcriptional regulator with XRE-family HTH domain|nr:helix-turn-helix transcriptional regulator [Trebonia sp.]
MTAGRLGEYLRARRELLTPAEAGLPDGGIRRVPGLKRGEVALLAGISAEYYTRLEQGHDKHPSEQVLTAIARALQLDEPSAAHLFGLASPGPRPGRPRARPPERIPATVQRILDSLPLQPAFVQGRHMDVLAANRLMTALSPMYRPGTNIVRAAFLDHAVEELFADPEQRLSHAVSGLRALAGPDGGADDDPRLAELVGELSLKSAEFRRLWSRHDVRPHTSGGLHRLRHAVAGDLEMHYDKFLVAGADRQMLVIYQAEPGSRSQEALAFLAATLVREVPR